MPKITIVTGLEHSVNNSVVWGEIQDNADGIAEETANNIFDPFFTTKAPDKGTGLGLSISKSIVEGFGGELSFTTHKNEGTTFRITFPSSHHLEKRELNDAAE